MLRKLFVIMSIALSLVFADFVAAETRTLEQEKAFMKYVADSINDYVQSTRWDEAGRSYQPEADKIAAIIEKFGFVHDDYGVTIGGGKLTKLPMGIVVIIAGKADPIKKPTWKFIWPIPENIMKEQILKQMIPRAPESEPKKEIPFPKPNTRRYKVDI